MDPKMLQMVEQLKNDKEALSRITSSPDARRLIAQLQKSNSSALQKAAAGNTADLAKTISGMMQNQETAALIRRIMQSLQN